MKTIVIGDIHGCYNTLLRLIDRLGEQFTTADKVIFLGDYVDRGKKSYEVLTLLHKLQMAQPQRIICLMGNHEDLMLRGVRFNLGQLVTDDDYLVWAAYNGGYATLESFLQHSEMPDAFFEWMSGLPLYYEDEHFLYAHAGVTYPRPRDNGRNDFLWDRTYLKIKKPFPMKPVIFGHTPCKEVTTTPSGDICIDTSCVFGGKLTALIITDGTITDTVQEPSVG